ncbi:hypothetical protein JCM11251_003497 [Rhodosporidiobolus azoricus]
MSGISFKIQAPSRPSSASAPPSRPSSAASRARPPHSSSTRNGHHDDDGADSEDDEGAFGAAGRDSKRRRLEKGDEEVVEFGRNGATSKNPKAAPSGPLVIPALPNKDWRKAAEELRAGRNVGSRRKKEMYLPEASGGMRMAGAGERGNPAPPAADAEDKMNTEEVVGGLEKPVKKELLPDARGAPEVDIVEEKVTSSTEPAPRAAVQPETEEQRALRELLGEEAAKNLEPAELDAIVSAADDRGGPISEEQAFKKDLDSRPDEATLDDYARVPVGQFGLAMLRGMGWQPGQAASRSGRGVVEAHVPSSRPALLGIGAKPMAEVMDDGKGKGKGKSAGGAGQTRKRDDMKFVPLMKRERERIEGPGGGEGSGSGRSTPITNGSTSSSRRSSRSPPPSSSSRRDRDRDDRDSRRRYDDDRSSSRRGSDREREYESSSSSRRDRDRGSSRREYDDDRRSSSRRDYDDDRDRRGGGSSSSSRRHEDDRDRRDRDRRKDDDRERGSSRRY